MVLETIIIAAAYVFLPLTGENPGFSEIATASAIFTIFTLILLLIFFAGQDRNPESQSVHTLAAVSLKFFLELLFVFLWFFEGKKSGLSSVILFFVLYLAFTLFSIFVILKTLKHKSL